MKNRYNQCIGVIALTAMLGGCGGMCQEEVPPGYIGVLKQHDGVQKELLGPGHHTCWNRDRLILVEAREKMSFESKMKIRCKDRMNITLDLKVRHRLKRDKKSVLFVIDAFGSRIKWKGKEKKVGVLAYKEVAKVYVEHQAREITRLIIGGKGAQKGKTDDGTWKGYNTEEVRANRAAIKKAVFDALVARTKDSPVEIREVMISNIDPPRVISDAIVKAKRREVEIKEEKAKAAKKELVEKNEQKLKMLAEKNAQAIKTLQADNAIALAKKKKAVIAEQSEAEGLKMRILGKYANAAYFRLRKLENDALYAVHARSVIVKSRGDKVTPFVGNLR